ncbi:hypothetical protein GEMRC1_001139 [Eukaryota sp. GEM-RC1]
MDIDLFSPSPLRASFAHQRQEQQQEVIVDIPEDDERPEVQVQIEREPDYAEEEPIAAAVQENGAEAVDKRKRRSQKVAPLAKRKACLEWMQQEKLNGAVKIPSRAIREFPDVFSSNANAALVKASRMFKDHESQLEKLSRTTMTVQPVQVNGRKKVHLKAVAGRGRKQEEWVIWLYEELVAKFSRLASAGVKFSTSLLLILARDVLEKSEHDTFNIDFISKHGRR